MERFIRPFIQIHVQYKLTMMLMCVGKVIDFSPLHIYCINLPPVLFIFDCTVEREPRVALAL
jgi:hypothetical protein